MQLRLDYKYVCLHEGANAHAANETAGGDSTQDAEEPKPKAKARVKSKGSPKLIGGANLAMAMMACVSMMHPLITDQCSVPAVGPQQ